MSNIFLNKLLNYFHITEEDYIKLTKNINKNSLPSYLRFNNILNVKNYFLDVIKHKKKIMIYGDYDCDGIMSVSIMSLLFRYFRAEFDFYIPLRDKDGYGLTIDKINEFNKKGYNIILCVDNGITLTKEVDYANSLGIEVIIFDHHEYDKNNIPNAKYILHPIYSNFGEINLSAGAVCFYFSWCLLGHIDDYLLVLGAISILSDMMMLQGYNRDLVKLGLYYINLNRYKNICELVDNVCNIDEDTLTLNLIPKINAIVRLVLNAENRKIVDYFINLNNPYLYNEKKWINEKNFEKKNKIQQFDNYDFDDLSKNPGIILNVNVEEGLCGLIANKFLNKFNLPTIILTPNTEEPSILKGSIRTKEGFDIIDFFNDIGDLLITKGGHKFAGGLSFNKNNFESIKKKFYEYSTKHPFTNNENTIEISLEDLNLDNYQILKSFKPFGEGFKEPKFKINSFEVTKFIKSKDEKHLLYYDRNHPIQITYFNFDEHIFEKNYVTLIGKFKENNYQNKLFYQLQVERFE